jgi:hypothetical protein
MNVTAGGIFTGASSTAEAGNCHGSLPFLGLTGRRSDLDPDTLLRFNPDAGREICGFDDQEGSIVTLEMGL